MDCVWVSGFILQVCLGSPALENSAINYGVLDIFYVGSDVVRSKNLRKIILVAEDGELRSHSGILY